MRNNIMIVCSSHYFVFLGEETRFVQNGKKWLYSNFFSFFVKLQKIIFTLTYKSGLYHYMFFRASITMYFLFLIIFNVNNLKKIGLNKTLNKNHCAVVQLVIVIIIMLCKFCIHIYCPKLRFSYIIKFKWLKAKQIYSTHF